MKNNHQEDFAKIFKNSKDNDRLNYFLEWYKKPLYKDELTELAYFYNGKKWELLKDNHLKFVITQFFDEKGVSYNYNNIESLYKLILVKSPTLGKQNLNVIPFSNGVIDRKTGRFLPHNQNYFLRNTLPIYYSLENKPIPNFEKWLNWVSQNNEQKKRTILAAFYMILTNSYEWQLFLEITGVGGSGKSIFNEIAIMLVGEENSTSVYLKDLEKISARTKLLDKMLIFAPDQGRIVTDGSILKALTGGDMMGFEPKYKAAFDARIQSIFLMTNNEPVIFTENNGGIGRRRVLFNFSQKVPENMKDEYLKEKLKEEIPQIINLIITTFKNSPQEAKKLLEAQKSGEEALAIKTKNDHLMHFASFLETRESNSGGLKPGITTNREDNNFMNALYSAYINYCTYYQIGKPIRRNSFLDDLKNALTEHGIKYPVFESVRDGFKRTNIYFKNDIAEVLNEWRGYS
ncbi:phage/plasmid primase, P4 family, C-terminal domain [Mannheimia haemolytica]|uniref:DNA primase family protein n=1 Tax=Mannheimia haemolytica TaxID=75985 RepID=UPI000DA3C3C6|nr:phage/plasmid primase, P4 family [Mannheimia haemolytica]SQE29854.1 phage/plasmid primase, P4 family, C-terminal domain [Mannheimia haemolytica]